MPLPYASESESFRIWFDLEHKAEIFESVRLELGDSLERIESDNKTTNFLKRIPNKSIKNYKLKNTPLEKIVRQPYVEKIGLLLMNFLNTDFDDFYNTYDNFYSIYGYEFLYDFIVPFTGFEEKYATEKAAFDRIKQMHEQASCDLWELQDDFRKIVDLIYNLNNDKYSKYSPKEKISACIARDEFNLRFYSSAIITKPMVNNYNYENASKLSFDEVISNMKEHSYMLEIIDVYLITRIEILLFIILYKLIDYNFIVKKCAICNKYFVPMKANELYCEFINEKNNNTICREFGAFQKYKSNIENIPGLLEYRRTYNRKSNIVSRNKDNFELKSQFNKWRKLAQEEVKKFKRNEISADELYDWMIKNK